MAKVSGRQSDPAAASAVELQAGLLDAMEEALGAAFIVYDGNDHIVHSSRQIGHFFPVAPHFLRPGTRLRDFLGAVYDRKIATNPARSATESAGREEWIAESIATHWKERTDFQQQDALGRWLRFSRRRLPNGYGLCIVTDISEQKKREEQWRADIERVQLTEEILDNLPYPVVVQDRNMTVVAVNKSFCSMWNANYETALGNPVASVFDEPLASGMVAACRHTLDTGVPSVVAETIAYENGERDEVRIRSHRVGKPGRYFVVSGFESELQHQDHDGPHNPAPSRQNTLKRVEVSAVRPSPTVLAGRKVVIVTADSAFDAACMKVLTAMGAETCSVRNEREAEALFEVAASVAVVVDFAVVDTQMDLRCLEIADCHARGVIALDRYRIDTDLAPRLLGQVNDQPPRAPLADDWEISIPEQGHPVGHQSTPDVLVAEDNPVNQIVFSQILEGLGYRYRIVDTGNEAVRLWEELRPAIVLMDLTLPGLNGIEATREIRRRDECLGYATPIVGVLVQAFDNTADDCIASGMNDVVVKPVSPDMIDAVLRRLAPTLASKTLS
ncbi:response regulator [Ciceribacter sp. L1K22]|uniref:response regulator n=1 Tax=Ciceribacter sp. L1K22 TaxID=2820275 RepID=UPI001ABDB6AE|nr:response regulator [Ciceribacter sp. L1K22]MBO3759048.1 response regulator [Ciceribacter sp. L1K22]